MTRNTKVHLTIISTGLSLIRGHAYTLLEAIIILQYQVILHIQLYSEMLRSYAIIRLKTLRGIKPFAWWRHEMETFSVLLAICAGIVWVLREAHWHWEGLSHSHGDVIKWKLFTALLAICAENSPVPGEFPAQKPMTRNFDGFFDLRPNKLFSKQSWGGWFETPWRPLSGHRNVRANIENSSLEDQGGCQIIDLNRGNCITSSTILFFYYSRDCN